MDDQFSDDATEAISPGGTGVSDDDFRKSRTPTDALADETITAAVPRIVMRRLMRGEPVAIVVAVPGADWIEPVSDAVTALAPMTLVVKRDGSQRRVHLPSVGNDEVADKLRRGHPVVGVSQSPEAFLPSSLLALADAHVALRVPNGAALRRILTRCQRRPTPRDVPDGACEGLSIHEIAAAIGKGASGRDVLSGLVRLRAAKLAQVDPSGPTLNKWPGVSGPARDWAEKLSADWLTWKQGAISFAALDSAAMLYGPPGVGKTMLVRSLARTLGVPLHETSPGAWFTGLSDGALGGVSQAFMRSWEGAIADARSTGAIYFLDEADGLPDRATLSDRAREWWTSLLSLILTALTTDRTGLILIGATNAGSSAAAGSSIDAALRRRFGRSLIVGLPTAFDLSEVVSYHLAGALSPADVAPVVNLTSGASAATAANWARDALTLARDAGRAVTAEDVLAAALPPDRRSPQSVWRTAIHEAAHAVVAEAVGRHVQHATIVETAETDGLTRILRDPSEPMTASSVDRALIAGLAGRAGEEVFLGEPSAGAEGDLASATAALAAVHASAGIGKFLLHRAPAPAAADLLKYDPALREVIEQPRGVLDKEALADGRAYRTDIERVAKALVERRLLTGDEIRVLAIAVASGGQP